MFVKKLFDYSFINVFILLLISCSDQLEPEEIKNDLIPLNVGNSWSYKITSYDSSGIISYTNYEISKIYKDTIISNTKWYSYGKNTDGVWYTNKIDGYWQHVLSRFTELKMDTSVVVFKYPVIVGDVYGDTNMLKEVKSINEELIVSAGHFNVTHIRNTYLSNNNYLLHSLDVYIAPKIGIVKVIQKGKKSDGKHFIVYESELESYLLE